MAVDTLPWRGTAPTSGAPYCPLEIDLRFSLATNRRCHLFVPPCVANGKCFLRQFTCFRANNPRNT
ncbi:hypothetical protein Pla52o_52910 [Novipirellula galeiformis]|uniref:Uncharacterized protein n=1 Tax=Novipirellula galeiformis TaxID=2528004 RepID=A0A5C6BZB2_9BACT|nr:hypothetical protein Pla52o_52910 [Novipirellula galeiformis]